MSLSMLDYVGGANMPTVLREGPYHFSFFSSDLNEPPHIHVIRDRNIAKFWLEPVSLEDNYGHKQHELRKIEKRVVFHRELFLEAWHENFNR